MNKQFLEKCKGCRGMYEFRPYPSFLHINKKYLACEFFYLKKLDKTIIFECPCWECVVKPMCSSSDDIRDSCSEFSNLRKSLPPFIVKPRESISSSDISSSVTSTSSTSDCGPK